MPEMKKKPDQKQFHRVILFLGLISMGIFAVGLLGALLFLREVIREQILNRDGILLTSVAQHFLDAADGGTTTDLIDVALESSQLSGVIGLRLFSPEGENLARIPATLYTTVLPAADLQELGRGDPVVRYFPDLPLDTLFSDQVDFEKPQSFPTTEVLTPILAADGTLEAVLQYWLDGQAVAHELGHLDQFLGGLGLVIFISGGLIFLLVFLIARKRLLEMGLLLAEQNRSLEKANTELALAARTSAIGSVTSHLFHGLKNPLAGLKAYLQLTGKDEEAMAMANRMQSLINESLSIISGQENHHQVQLSLGEFRTLLERRLGVQQSERVILQFSGQASLPARRAQLLLLILQNLVDNALEASGPESKVHLELNAGPDRLRAEVRDSGPGLPEQVRGRLFEPVRSTKQNGTGVGLAISAALARHIPADLELVETGPAGTTFSISMPL